MFRSDVADSSQIAQRTKRITYKTMPIYEGARRLAHWLKNITERRLHWYGHVMRGDGEHILRKVLRADIPGKGREDYRKQDGKTRER